MNNKLIIILALIGVLVVSGCDKLNPISMDECTDSINNQYYLKGCEQYDDYEYHYNLRTEWEDSLSNSSYTINRHYDECLINDSTIYYTEFNPFEQWKNDYYNNERSNQSIFEEFAYSFGIPVDCPDNEYMFGYEFCYQKWIGCNQTHNYKNGSSIKLVI